MWTETSKDCPCGGIGSDGVKGRQEFRWTATGPEARSEMEAWIHHLKEEYREKDQSYEVKVEQEGSHIRINLGHRAEAGSLTERQGRRNSPGAGMRQSTPTGKRAFGNTQMRGGAHLEQRPSWDRRELKAERKKPHPRQ